jgi:hypothetical protein
MIRSEELISAAIDRFRVWQPDVLVVVTMAEILTELFEHPYLSQVVTSFRVNFHFGDDPDQFTEIVFNCGMNATVVVHHTEFMGAGFIVNARLPVARESVTTTNFPDDRRHELFEKIRTVIWPTIDQFPFVRSLREHGDLGDVYI